MKKILAIALVLVFGSQLHTPLKADEGMWLPMFIKRLNYEDMKKLGLQLTPEEIYSVNNSSLKDAVVMLSGGSCTAEMISPNGLMLTNHHCAYGAIQQNSSPENDYLTDGFWAKNYGEELRAKGTTASFLVRMEDVSEEINSALEGVESEAERNQIIRTMSDSIQKAATEDTHYNANVKSFFEGNEFYLFVYETFRDVRLTGVPPQSIGKYGGDTDNWMWPRHTGDFTMMRVYMAPDGTPADYSEENIPYEPKHFLPISISGVEEGDYAMIMGNPGRTDRYLTSSGVNLAITSDQPARVKLRGARLDIMKEHMAASDEVRIKYSSKYARVSNYWKYFIGQTQQIKQNNVLEAKIKEEDAFRDWASANADRQAQYGRALDLIDEANETLLKYNLPQVYLQEAIFGSEILTMGYYLSAMRAILGQKDPDPETLNKEIQTVKSRMENFYKDYDRDLDREVTAKVLELYHEDIPEEMQPEYFKKLVKKEKGDFTKVADRIFKKSMVHTSGDLADFLRNPKGKKLDKDVAVRLAGAFMAKYRKDIQPGMAPAYSKRAEGDRLFVAGLREMQPERKFYPNANSTMRLTYGQVLSYEPRDAVHYNYITKIEGKMEKMDNDDPEFVVPDKMVELFESRDFGRYADANGDLILNFLSNNDITGGNSGSPVINGKGELIGLAFDGNWEAMSGDIFFEDEVQRTISVDARYILFIVDKFAGAQNLIDEMKIVGGAVSKIPAKHKTQSSDQLQPQTK